jgi:hypothetical protein
MPHETHDFGTGLRAHLGLDAAQLELAAEPVAPPEQGDAQPVAQLVEARVGETELGEPEAPQDELAAREAELNERERSLLEREAALKSRASSLLETARFLYDEIVNATPEQLDELARMRRRKSVA